MGNQKIPETDYLFLVHPPPRKKKRITQILPALIP
jgi:hypothetical protein